MRYCIKILSIIFFAAPVAGAAFFSSCSRDIEIINLPHIDSLPSLTVRDFSTVYTDSAKLQMIIEAPLLYRFTGIQEPYSEFPEGIKVTFYDGHDKPTSSLDAGTARYDDNKKTWELKNGVVVVNPDNERLETEILFWDEDKELVYTDRFVKITRTDQIIMGTGLESNSRFTSMRIKNVSATIYLDDE